MAEILNMRPLQVLLVEDNDSDAYLVQSTLGSVYAQEFDLARAPHIEAAMTHLGKGAFDVGLLDMSLPGLCGLEGLRAMQNTAPALPIVVLTGNKDEALALAAVKFGAQDYLNKDEVTPPAMRRAMRYAIERKHFEETLIHMANYDQLTGLVNRGLFESRLEMALARGKRSGVGTGILFLDLDRFKQINDTLGHGAGDALLQAVAGRLKQCLRNYDTVARFGGDEFAVLLEDIKQLSDCAGAAQKIVACLSRPYTLPGGYAADIGVSIGIASSLDAPAAAAELMQQADLAMYRAKSATGNDFRFSAQETNAAAHLPHKTI